MLFPSILFFCCLGTFSINNNLQDIGITAAFGLLGYLLLRLKLDPAPLMLGFILGPMLEEYFRRTMVLGHGDLRSFVAEPVSAALLGLTAVIIVTQLVLTALRAAKRPPKQPMETLA